MPYQIARTKKVAQERERRKQRVASVIVNSLMVMGLVGCLITSIRLLLPGWKYIATSPAIISAIFPAIVLGVIAFLWAYNSIRRDSSMDLASKVAASLTMTVIVGGCVFVAMFLFMSAVFWVSEWPTRSTSQLVFAGKVVNEQTGAWLRNED